MSTAAARRTDVHSPANLVPEDYEFAYAYDAHPEEGTPPKQRMAALHLLLEEGWRFGGVHGGDTCDHCGTRLRYVAVMKHLPSHRLIIVGETCLENRFALASEEFHRLRRAAKLHRERNTRAERTEAFLADERNAAAIEWLREEAPKALDRQYERELRSGFSEEDDPFESRLLASFERNGNLTEAQVDAVYASIERQRKRAAAREERDARLPDPAPVIEGRVAVEGEVLSISSKDNPYDGSVRLVMTVCDDRGFRVWGTVPASIERELDGLIRERREAGTLGGSNRPGGVYAALLSAPEDVEVPVLRVRFTAGVERSDRDETFGFFKRPTRAEVIA